jgi:hypothetical protein
MQASRSFSTAVVLSSVSVFSLQHADSTVTKTLTAEVEDDGNKTQWQMRLHAVAAEDDATANLPHSALFDGRRSSSPIYSLVLQSERRRGHGV